MYRFQKMMAVGIAAALLGSSLSAAPPSKDDEDCGCGRFGTTVAFVDSPRDAAKLARQQEKLVFVLHVSGNFETPEFT
jgi:hypothetical protein